MLGFGPVASTAISGSVFKIVSVPVAVSAAIGLAFPVSVTAGQTFAATASISLDFGLSATALVRQATAIELPIGFSLSATLRDYGRPLIITAMTQSYAVRAVPADYTLKALPQSFTLRGYK